MCHHKTYYRHNRHMLTDKDHSGVLVKQRRTPRSPSLFGPPNPTHIFPVETMLAYISIVLGCLEWMPVWHCLSNKKLDIGKLLRHFVRHYTDYNYSIYTLIGLDIFIRWSVHWNIVRINVLPLFGWWGCSGFQNFLNGFTHTILAKIFPHTCNPTSRAVSN